MDALGKQDGTNACPLHSIPSQAQPVVVVSLASVHPFTLERALTISRRCLKKSTASAQAADSRVPMPFLSSFPTAWLLLP